MAPRYGWPLIPIEQPQLHDGDGAGGRIAGEPGRRM